MDGSCPVPDLVHRHGWAGRFFQLTVEFVVTTEALVARYTRQFEIGFLL